MSIIVLRRNVVTNQSTLIPEMEVLVRIPFDLVNIVNGDDTTAPDAILASSFRQLIHRQLESEKIASMSSPMLYDGLEELDEILENHGVTENYDEWVSYVKDYQIELDKALSDSSVDFPRVEEFITDEAWIVGKYMLESVATYDNQSLTASSFVCNKLEDLSSIISSLKYVYLVSKYGLLNPSRGEYVTTYTIRGVKK